MKNPLNFLLVSLSFLGPATSAYSQVSYFAAVDIEVNLAEVSGNQLKPISTWDPSPEVIDAKGKGKIKGTPTHVQVVSLVDDKKETRAMAISTPETKKLVFDAESTALASAFLLPGIMMPVPTAIKDRIQKIRAVSTFSELVKYLKRNLKDKGYDKIKDDPSYPIFKFMSEYQRMNAIKR